MAQTVEIATILNARDIDHANRTAIATVIRGDAARHGQKIQIAFGNGQPPRIPFLVRNALGNRDFGFLYGDKPGFQPKLPVRTNHLVLLWDGLPATAPSGTNPIQARNLKWTYAKAWHAEEELMDEEFEWRLACYGGNRRVKPGDLERICSWGFLRKTHGRNMLRNILKVNGHSLDLHELYGGSRIIWPDAADTRFYLQAKKPKEKHWYIAKPVKPVNVSV